MANASATPFSSRRSLRARPTRAGEEYHPIRLADAARVLVPAVLAAEDHRFFEHGGLDVRGLLRAAWANLPGRAGLGRRQHHHPAAGQEPAGWVQANVLAKASRGVAGHDGQWRYSKEQILEAYLNRNLYGPARLAGDPRSGRGRASVFWQEVHQLRARRGCADRRVSSRPNSYSPVGNPRTSSTAP